MTRQLLVHGQGLDSLYFEAVFCLVPLHLSDDAEGAEGLLATVFGGSPVRGGAGYLPVMALFCPHLRQGAGDGDIFCQSLEGWDAACGFVHRLFWVAPLLPHMQLNFSGLLLTCLEFQGGNTTGTAVLHLTPQGTNR